MPISSAVQCGLGKVIAAEMNSKSNPPINLHKVMVLPTSEWRRIQDSVNHVNKQHERLIQVAREREDLQRRSKEVVRNWSNTIAGQRQKKLEAKKIREEIEEEERKQIDIEEAKFQEQKRKEAIERAQTLQYYQLDRVKRFHSALLMTEVLKEREAQIELKKRKDKASKDVGKEIQAMMMQKEALALQQEWLKAVEEKQKCLAVAETLKQQIKEHQQAREMEKMEQKKEAEEFERFKEMYIKEQNKCEQKKQEEKRNIMKAYQDEFTHRTILQAAEAEKQDLEEEREKLFVKARSKMLKLRKEKEAEKFREIQRHREALVGKLAAYHQEQITNEEELISKAAVEAEAKQAKQQHERDESKKAMMKSIAEHREAVQKELENRKQEQKQEDIKMLNARKASDIAFIQKQINKEQKMKAAARMLQDSHIHHMAEKHAQQQRMKKKEQELEARNAGLIAQDEEHFRNYAGHVIEKAYMAQKNTSLLYKATKQGMGEGLRPVFRGVIPSYINSDQSGVLLPSYTCNHAQGIKEMNETSDIQMSKKRLGFTW